MTDVLKSPSELVYEAVELACERNPRLVFEPYYQMKAAATILAEAVIVGLKRELRMTANVPAAVSADGMHESDRGGLHNDEEVLLGCMPPKGQPRAAQAKAEAAKTL